MSAFVAAGQATAQGQEGEAPPPPPVTVVTLKAEDVTLTSSLPGRVVAQSEANLRPQVSGLIIERLFEEGRQVTEGDPLYRIDPRTYEAAVAQAQAALAQAEAAAAAARREATRAETLRDRRVTSEQAQDAAIAARDAADAAVEAAKAQLLAANIDLDRTTITAPIDGVIGLAQASAGALVTAGQAESLAVIRKIDPVRVDVTQSAADIIRWQRQGPEAALPAGGDRTVSLRLADGSIYEHTGSLTGAEPHVNETTGVVTLRVEFENPEGFLLPGMYVQAEIPQAQLPDAILAPQEGVTRDRRGRPVAMVVNDQNMVEERQLDIVQDRGNRWIVKEGLNDGDRLIVEGLQRIGPGMQVTPEEQAETPAADAPAAEPAAPAAEGEAPATEGEAAAAEGQQQPEDQPEASGN
nr:efflux RND transporter periplasmic adaptor subunit [Paracoccus amoyensis]